MPNEEAPAAVDANDEDRWFRELGLPTFVPLRRWFTDLPRRVAPLVVFVTLLRFLLQDAVDELIDLGIKLFGENDWAIFTLVVAVFALSAGIAWIGYLITRAVLRRASKGIGTAIAVVLLIGCVVLLVWYGYASAPRAVVSPAIWALVIIGGCVLITGMGGGALIAWASRLAVRNVAAIGHMASIALPVILMLVVFAFFSAEVWQMATALSWGSLWLVGLVVGVLAVIVVLRVAASELSEDGVVAVSNRQHHDLLAGTPAATLQGRPVRHQPLRAVQRYNIMLVMSFAQILQALLFAALLSVILILFGAVAVPEGVVSLWLGPGSAKQPMVVEAIKVGNATLPITVNLVKSAVLLSLIAALPFVLSAVSEQRYRERFFDPIMVDMRQAIVVRDAVMSRDAAQVMQVKQRRRVRRRRRGR